MVEALNLFLNAVTLWLVFWALRGQPRKSEDVSGAEKQADTAEQKKRHEEPTLSSTSVRRR